MGGEPDYLALRVHQEDGRTEARLERLRGAPLGPGEVRIRGRYSSVNYKDALAGTGRGKVMRRHPLVGGIDVAGEVQDSADARFRPGDRVLVTGYGMSQDHDGGYAELAQVPGDWVVPLPEGLSPYQAMLLGTAGFTAGLAVERLERNGQVPELGPILVTGATGGVGSLSIDLWSGLGYAVSALTGKPEEADVLRELGATEVHDRHRLELGQRPLEHVRWGGAVDSLGGETLAWLTRTVAPGGGIASIGLAAGADLNTTVMPFILRGIGLLGINSASCPMPLRARVWRRLATDLRPRHLDRVATATVGLAGLAEVFEEMLAGRHRGRTVVDLTVGG